MPSVLITGANRGLGLEFARQYLADGWQVYATCRHPASASELRRLADSSGHKLRILALDVTEPGSIKTAAAELDGQAIDLLLNNAGVGGARGQTIGNIGYVTWAKVVEVNLAQPENGRMGMHLRDHHGAVQSAGGFTTGCLRSLSLATMIAG